MVQSTPVPHQVMHSKTLRRLTLSRWSKSLMENSFQPQFPQQCWLAALEVDLPKASFIPGSHRNRRDVFTGSSRSGGPSHTMRRALLCVTASSDRRCQLWVISGHRSTSAQCPLYPQKRTLELSSEMSALC